MVISEKRNFLFGAWPIGTPFLGQKIVIFRGFSKLLGEYLLKQKAVVLKPDESKFKVIIARNV